MELQVTHHLTQATDNTPFTHQDGPRKGKAILNKPYWVNLGDALWFDFIRPDMNMQYFKTNLANGHIFYLKEITNP